VLDATKDLTTSTQDTEWKGLSLEDLRHARTLVVVNKMYAKPIVSEYAFTTLVLLLYQGTKSDGQRKDFRGMSAASRQTLRTMQESHGKFV
jgi:hypothetical protein